NNRTVRQLLHVACRNAICKGWGDHKTYASDRTGILARRQQHHCFIAAARIRIPNSDIRGWQIATEQRSLAIAGLVTKDAGLIDGKKVRWVENGAHQIRRPQALALGLRRKLARYTRSFEK